MGKKCHLQSNPPVLKRFQISTTKFCQNLSYFVKGVCQCTCMEISIHVANLLDSLCLFNFKPLYESMTNI